MPGRGWRKQHPIVHRKLRIDIPEELDDRIREAMRQEGEGYTSPFIRKLIERGLRFGDLKVGS